LAVNQTVAFRREISLVEAEGRTSLRDTLLGRELALDAALEATARAVDGRRSFEAVVGAAIEGGLTRPIAMRALRSLLLLNLFDGTGFEAIDALRARRDGLELLRGAVLPEARFECQGSGACCRAYSLGPIAPGDEAKVMALDLAAAFPEAGGVYFESHALPGGASARYLRRVNGGCVFLQSDAHCGLHARFGPDAKPSTCKVFPLSHVVRFDGAHVFDRGECSRFSTSARAGEPLARTPQRLLPVMQQERRLEHPIVQLAPGIVVDFALYAPLVQRAIEECAAPGITAPEALRALARRTTTLVSLLEELPLNLAAPGAALAQVLATPRALLRTEPPRQPHAWLSRRIARRRRAPASV
jgi:Fe-S-cluster containining protein